MEFGTPEFEEWFASELAPAIKCAVIKYAVDFGTSLHTKDDLVHEMYAMALDLFKRGKIDPNRGLKQCAAIIRMKAHDEIWKLRLNHGMPGVRYTRTFARKADAVKCYYIYSSAAELDPDSNEAFFDKSASTEKSLENDDLRKTLLDLLRRLSPTEREVLIGTEVHGRKVKEIAADMNVKPSRLSSVRLLALEKLRQVIFARCSYELRDKLLEAMEEK